MDEARTEPQVETEGDIYMYITHAEKGGFKSERADHMINWSCIWQV